MKIKVTRAMLINMILDLLFGIFFMYFLLTTDSSNGYRWIITIFAAYDFTDIIMSIRKIIKLNKK
ncbi:hypothetical protein A7K95_04070 [Pediococcus parvulus]|jgi:hypothetical protein|uniref:DUF3923 domain-containing protein n=1 Tax=Pediococcus parvulus TaxID=54062 RepID=A0ABX2UH42_9LACO|nr:hypothetical protein [Pediococcus parvulus]MDN5574578.1 hypothetical protein [Pediococcus sp.]MCT3031310.1 hypothetical protein [Pediococcus parvulus]MCT3034403.1 hypothetical protein [Pediococcus parvulus]OAD64518.1 hypothetical protein A7K95_04070 [Pediococcus parvulus]